MVKESSLENILVKKITAKKGLAIKLFSTWFTGLPDRLILLPGGRIFFVELKANHTATRVSEKRQRRQKFVREQLQKLGFTVLVLDNVEKINEFTDGI